MRVGPDHDRCAPRNSALIIGAPARAGGAPTTCETMPSPTSHGYISQRLRLHYFDWGNAGAPPLVLVHGGRDHARSWDRVAEQLCGSWHVIAPDLRGHGDSQWSLDGSYTMAGYLYDLAQLVERRALAPVSLVGHSLGGNIATRYAGIYPDKVRRLVSIEGLGPSPKVLAERGAKSMAERLRDWIESQRGLAGRMPRRYATMEDAVARMQAANKHLSLEQARHLTRYGVDQNEDGTFSWKFDPYLHVFPPIDLAVADIEALWARVACPTLLVYGKESWASNPQEDGRARHFKNARVVMVEKAGHWVHHDRTDFFVDLVRGFLHDTA
jgi:pimeloyl-ACP methyl ester carboxylesterase